jgi:hypothetical protein
VAAFTLDVGSAHAFGLRYLHDHFHSGNGLAWGGYGAEVRALGKGGSVFEAAAGLLVLRGGLGVEQAVSLEVAGGIVGGERAQGMLLLGAFMSAYFFEIGVSGQGSFGPTEQPDWMAPVSFGLRVNVPFQKTEPNIARHSPLPAGRVQVVPSFTGPEDDGDID